MVYRFQLQTHAFFHKNIFVKNELLIPQNKLQLFLPSHFSDLKQAGYYSFYEQLQPQKNNQL